MVWALETLFSMYYLCLVPNSQRHIAFALALTFELSEKKMISSNYLSILIRLYNQKVLKTYFKAFYVCMFTCLLILSQSFCSKPTCSASTNHSILTLLTSKAYLHTGCPKKNALLSLKAYNSGLEAAIGTSRDSFGILRL